MLDKITAFLDALLINALLITIFVLSTEWAFKPDVVLPEEEVIQVVALDESQVQDAIKLVKQEEKRHLEAQQAEQRELEKIAYEPQHKGEPHKPKDKIEPPKPKEPVEDKQKRIKERKKQEQKQLEEANHKAQEKAEKERQRLEAAKRKAKQLDEERLAKESEKKQRKKVEDKQKERERLAKQEKAEEKKRQAREEQKRKTVEKRKEQKQSAKQEENRQAREAEKQRKAEAKQKAAAAAAAEKRKAAAAAAERRKKEAGEDAQQKRAQDSRARIGQVKAQIASRVKSRWRQPAGTNLSCVVFVSILPSGALIPRLSKSSGNGVFDQSAIAAVRSASPFPIPKELLGFFRGEGVSVTFRSH